MENANTYWENLSKRITDPSETKNKRPDTSDLEIEFLRPFVKADSQVLDIGSGTGLITNKLLPYVGHIVAVEKFEGFSKHTVEDEKLLLINADLIGFKMRKQFDAVLCTGVAQCFPKQDMIGIYENMFEMLKRGGQLLLRTHCGLEEDVLINKFSEELSTEYFAEYRQKEKELDLLRSIGFVDIEVHDIFPDTLNTWSNTRHFYFICKKPL